MICYTLNKGNRFLFSSWFFACYFPTSKKSEHTIGLVGALAMVIVCLWKVCSAAMYLVSGLVKISTDFYEEWELVYVASKYGTNCAALPSIKQILAILVISWPTNEILRSYKRKYLGLVADFRTQHLRRKRGGACWVTQVQISLAD